MTSHLHLITGDKELTKGHHRHLAITKDTVGLKSRLSVMRDAWRRYLYLHDKNGKAREWLLKSNVCCTFKKTSRLFILKLMIDFICNVSGNDLIIIRPSKLPGYNIVCKDFGLNGNTSPSGFKPSLIHPNSSWTSTGYLLNMLLLLCFVVISMEDYIIISVNKVVHFKRFKFLS